MINYMKKYFLLIVKCVFFYSTLTMELKPYAFYDINLTRNTILFILHSKLNN